MSDGWIKLYRQILENPALEANDSFAIFVREILLKAAHKPKRVMFRGRTVSLEPGQLLLSIRCLAASRKINKDRAHRVVKALEKHDIIKTDSETGTVRVTVCNWGTYQGSIQLDETLDETKVRQSRDSRETQNKNVRTYSESDTTVRTKDSDSQFDTNNSPSDDDGNPKPQTKFPSLSRLSKPGGKNVYPDPFEHFWNALPANSKRRKAAVYGHWVKLANSKAIGPAALWKAARRYAGHGPEFPLGGVNWLKDEEFVQYLDENFCNTLKSQGNSNGKPHASSKSIRGGGAIDAALNIAEELGIDLEDKPETSIAADYEVVAGDEAYPGARGPEEGNHEALARSFGQGQIGMDDSGYGSLAPQRELVAGNR